MCTRAGKEAADRESSGVKLLDEIRDNYIEECLLVCKTCPTNTKAKTKWPVKV